MSYKLAISKPTKNVLTATDADDFIFNSDYDTLKYETQGKITVTVDYSDYYHSEYNDIYGFMYYHRKVGTVAHGLGYTPYFAGYTISSDDPLEMIQLPYGFADAGYFVSESIYADSSNLYFVVMFNNSSNSGTADVELSYRIFKNDLEL
jgi:hypothetical protein